jgi:hypothetical protein
LGGRARRRKRASTPKGRVTRNQGRTARFFLRARMMLRMPVQKWQKRRVIQIMGTGLLERKEPRTNPYHNARGRSTQPEHFMNNAERFRESLPALRGPLKSSTANPWYKLSPEKVRDFSALFMKCPG